LLLLLLLLLLPPLLPRVYFWFVFGSFRFVFLPFPAVCSCFACFLLTFRFRFCSVLVPFFCRWLPFFWPLSAFFSAWIRRFSGISAVVFLLCCSLF